LQDDVSKKYSGSLEPDVKFKRRQAGFNGLAFGVSQLAVFGTFQLLLSGKLGFIDFMVALLSVMFCSFGAGQSGADFSALLLGSLS